MVLALMYLHDGARAWMGYPWEVLDVLFEGGLITDPARKAKSVALTDSGLAEAARCFHELLATESAVVAPPKPRASKAAALPRKSGKSIPLQSFNSANHAACGNCSACSGT
jgi:hypothetical protein